MPHRLIKKKRIAQLIFGKPDENRYNDPKQATQEARNTVTTQTTRRMLLAHNNRKHCVMCRKHCDVCSQ